MNKELSLENLTDVVINDLSAAEKERDLLIAALRCAEAWLTQPAQFTDSQNCSNILRGDCRAAVTAIRSALNKVSEECCVKSATPC